MQIIFKLNNRKPHKSNGQKTSLKFIPEKAERQQKKCQWVQFFLHFTFYFSLFVSEEENAQYKNDLFYIMNKRLQW